MRRPGQFRSDRSGVAALEFAIVAPILLLFILGIIGFGLYFTMEIAVTVAASEAARATVGALSTDSPSTIAKAAACNVLNAYSPLLSCAGATVSPVLSGTQITVTVSYSAASGLLAISPVGLPNPSSTAIVQYSAY